MTKNCPKMVLKHTDGTKIVLHTHAGLFSVFPAVNNSPTSCRVSSRSPGGSQQWLVFHSWGARRQREPKDHAHRHGHRPVHLKSLRAGNCLVSHFGSVSVHAENTAGRSITHQRWRSRRSNPGNDLWSQGRSLCKKTWGQRSSCNFHNPGNVWRKCLKKKKKKNSRPFQAPPSTSTPSWSVPPVCVQTPKFLPALFCTNATWNVPSFVFLKKITERFLMVWMLQVLPFNDVNLIVFLENSGSKKRSREWVEI